MVKIAFLSLLFSFSVAQAQSCPQDKEIKRLMSPCQKAYYKYAPECRFNNVSCLSLVLHGLVNKNLFDYRVDLRREYNTPLKRKHYRQTAEYRNLHKIMLKDLSDLPQATFCAEMKSYWLYDLNAKGFLFSPHSLIPKGRLFRLTKIERLSVGYDLVRTSEKEAVEIEGWETLADTKYAFFRVVGNQKGFVGVALTEYVWLVPHVSFDHEGFIEVEHEDSSCQEPSYYHYKVSR